MGIASQCGASELQRHFPEDQAACVSLLRRIVANMSGNPDARLLRDSSGSVAYKGRLYHYSYSFGPDLSLSIRAPEAESELANNPRQGLERFRSAGPDERGLLVAEFSKDVGSLSSTALERVFQGLFASNNLLAYLSGTTSQKMDTPLFVRDVLSLGGDPVAGRMVDELVTRILESNLVQSSDDKVFVPAIDALIAISRDAPSLRSKVLAEVGEFVSALGTHHNAAKPDIARILLPVLDDHASPAGNERILATLSTIRRNAVGAGRVVQLIDLHFRERIDRLADSAVAEVLRDAMSARDGTEGPDVWFPGDDLK